MKKNKIYLSLIFFVFIMLLIIPNKTKAVTTLYWPVQGHAEINTDNPWMPGDYRYNHKGIDITDSNIQGAEVRAAIGGTVYFLRKCPYQHTSALSCCDGYGNGLVIYGDDGRFYQYAHMEHNSMPSYVVLGGRIEKGQKLGKVGLTGWTTWYHLHFAINSNSSYWLGDTNPINEVYSNRYDTVAPTPVRDLGDNFYAFLIMNNWLYNADRDSNVVLENGTYNSHLVWNFVKQSDGTYTIKNMGTGRYLDIYNSNDYDGGIIRTFSYNGSSAQKFYVYGEPGQYVLRPQCLENRVVTVNNGGNAVGNKLNVWFYYAGAVTQLFQIWKVDPVESSILSYKTNGQSVNLNWNQGANVEKYNIIINSGTVGNLKEYKKEIGVTGTSYNINLPEGYYEVTVEGWNYFSHAFSNVVRFTISSDMKFKDVKKTDWFYGAVKYCYANNIIKGYDNGNFGPKDKISRGQIVTILYRCAGTPDVYGDSPFSDVQDKNKYYYKAVKWAKDKGIISGYDNGKFGPNDDITREQLAVMLCKYTEKNLGKNVKSTINLSTFKDYKSTSSWSLNAVKWAVDKGIIVGDMKLGYKRLLPKESASRAEAATMIMRFCKNILNMK